MEKTDFTMRVPIAVQFADEELATAGWQLTVDDRRCRRAPELCPWVMQDEGEA